MHESDSNTDISIFGHPEKKSIHAASRFLRSSLHRKSKVTKDIIEAPEDFTHVSHVGYERGKGFNVHGENDGLIKELQALGISESEIEQNQDFIQEYLQQHGSRRSSTSSASKSKGKGNTSLCNGSSFVMFPITIVGRRPPPPPPPRRIKMPSQYTNRSDHLPPPPPPPHPPPPTISTNQPTHVPPPLPARHPHPSSPAPPPPPSVATPSPALNDGRSNLMESIRATGGFGALKQGNHLRVTTGSDRALSPSPAESATPSPEDGSLVSSLANVLNQRKMAMQSDDENSDEEDDDWDWWTCKQMSRY